MIIQCWVNLKASTQIYMPSRAINFAVPRNSGGRIINRHTSIAGQRKVHGFTIKKRCLITFSVNTRMAKVELIGKLCFKANTNQSRYWDWLAAILEAFLIVHQKDGQ